MAPQKPKETPKARKGRETRVLTEDWKYLVGTAAAGDSSLWQKSIPSTAKPSGVPALPPSASIKPNESLWYWNEFTLPDTWKGQTARLQFLGVIGKLSVWFNGNLLGERKSSTATIEFNITPAMQPGKSNLLTVRLEPNTNKGAGLWQGVLLMAHDEAYLEDVSVRTTGVGTLQSDIRILNTSDKSGVAELDARLVNLTAPEKSLRSTHQSLTVSPGRNITILNTSMPKRQLRLWSPESPHLYALQLAFRQEKDILDTYEVRLGFREFGWDKQTLSINGQAFSPKSITPVFDQPLVIQSVDDKSKVRDLLQKMKSEGINIIYFDAPPKLLLEIADEVGMLLIIGTPADINPEQELAEMVAYIQRDRSHACVLGWRLRHPKSEAIRKLMELDRTRFVMIPEGAKPVLYPPNNPDVSVDIPLSLRPLLFGN